MRPIFIIILFLIIISIFLLSCSGKIDKGIVISKNYEAPTYKRSVMFTGKTMISTKVYDDADWVLIIKGSRKDGKQKSLRFEVDSLTYSTLKINDSILIQNDRVEKVYKLIP